MNITCSRSELSQALKMLKGIVSARTPKPILLGVLLDASDGRTLKLAATDLEQYAVAIVTQVEARMTGKTVIDLGKLSEIADACTSDTLDIDASGKTADTITTVKVRSDDSAFTLYTMDPKDFPPSPARDREGTILQVKAGEMARLFEATEFCAAKEATRYAFNGILFKVSDKGDIHAASTDGRRLSVAVAAAESVKKNNDIKPPIIPVRALKTLHQVLRRDEDAIVSINQLDNSITFEVDGLVLTSNLIEGQFPPYEDVIPQDTKTKVNVDIKTCVSAVRRASIVQADENPGLRFKFSKKNGLELFSRVNEKGESQVTMPCKVDGNEVEIGFNPGFFQQGLNACGDGEVTLELVAPNRPGLLRSKRFMHVIMPVNIQ